MKRSSPMHEVQICIVPDDPGDLMALPGLAVVPWMHLERPHHRNIPPSVQVCEASLWIPVSRMHEPSEIACNNACGLLEQVAKYRSTPVSPGSFCSSQRQTSTHDRIRWTARQPFRPDQAIRCIF